MQNFLGTLYVVGAAKSGKTSLVDKISSSGRLFVQDDEFKIINEFAEVGDLSEVPATAFGLAVVYDVSSAESFDHATDVCTTVFKRTQKNANIFPIRMLIGTKRDQARNNRQVSYQQAAELNQSFDGVWQEVSVTRNINVDNLLDLLKIHELNGIRQIAETIGLVNLPLLYVDQYSRNAANRPWHKQLMRLVDNQNQLNDDYFGRLNEVDAVADPMFSPYSSGQLTKTVVRSPQHQSNLKSNQNDDDIIQQNPQQYQEQQQSNTDDLQFLEEVEEYDELEPSDDSVEYQQPKTRIMESNFQYRNNIPTNQKIKAKPWIYRQQAPQEQSHDAKQQKVDYRESIRRRVQKQIDENVRLHINPGVYERFVLGNAKQIQKETSTRVNRRDILILPKQKINKNTMQFNTSLKSEGQIHSDQWSGILRSQRHSGYTNDIKYLQPPKEEINKPLLILEVEIRDNTYKIPIYNDSDPMEIARKFVATRKLHNSYIRVVRDLIIERLTHNSPKQAQKEYDPILSDSVTLRLSLNINSTEVVEDVYRGETATQVSRRLAKKYQVGFKDIHNIVSGMVKQ